MNKKQYCFTIDDNIRFLEDIQKSQPASIFEQPFLAMLNRLHLRFGLKVQFNMFYSYSPNSFSLTEMTDRYKDEFLSCRNWMRFSFHSRHNDPPFPYDNASSKVVMQDFNDVMINMERIAGKDCLAKTATLHYVSATSEACSELAKQGVLGLVGMFYNKPGREALHYYFSEKLSDIMWKENFYYDADTGLIFTRNHMVINQLYIEQIVPSLESCIQNNRNLKFLQVMIHEQYFYSDYANYQPDFAEKLETTFKWMEQNGFVSCFLEYSEGFSRNILK